MHQMLFSLLLMLFCLVSNSFSSSIASQIAYQGIITDLNGNPLKDSSGYVLTFTLDTIATGSSPVWTETQTVTTEKGMFAVMLGSVNALDTLRFDKQYWLSVRRDNGGQVGQKIKLGVVPYAKRASVADSAAKAGVAGKALSISDSSVTSANIKDGTITRADVSSQFKSPLSDSTDFARVADSAVWIRKSAITAGMIGSEQISNIDGSKITAQFGSQTVYGDRLSARSSLISNVVPQSIYDSLYYPTVEIQSGASGINNVAMRLIKGEPFPDNGYGAIQIDFLKKHDYWPTTVAIQGLYKNYLSQNWETFFSLDRYGKMFTKGSLTIGDKNGIILTSPNGTSYLITVNDDGTLKSTLK